MQAPLHLCDELLRPAAENHRRRLCLGAALKDVEALAANLHLVEAGARAEVPVLDVGAGALDRATDGLDDTPQVVCGDAACTEDVAVGKVLRSQVADGQLAQHDLGTRLDNCLELCVDDLPLGVDNGLVFGHVVDPDLCVVLFRLELQLDTEADNLGVLERLWLLLEAGVGKCLLESDTLDQQAVLHRATGHLLDANQALVQVVLVQRADGIDDHVGKEGPLAHDQLRVHRCACTLHQQVPERDWVALVNLDRHLLDSLDGLRTNSTGQHTDRHFIMARRDSPAAPPSCIP